VSAPVAASRRSPIHGTHRFVSIYQGATLDVHKCSCGATYNTEGTAPRGR